MLPQHGVRRIGSRSLLDDAQRLQIDEADQAMLQSQEQDKSSIKARKKEGIAAEAILSAEGGPVATG